MTEPTVSPDALVADAAVPGESPEQGGAADTRAVASVCIDSPLPHLDRLFEYAVPEELRATIAVGVRVKVPFGHRQLDGWVVGLSAHASFSGNLQEVRKVVGGVPTLADSVWRLARAVADRQAGVVADVLRLALPPRHARVERTWLREHPEAFDVEAHDADTRAEADDAGRRVDTHSEPSHPEPPQSGAPLIVHQQPHVGCDAIGNSVFVAAWVTDVVSLVENALGRGEATIVAVPDFRDIAQVAAALAERFPGETIARLDAGLDDDARYRAFLDLRAGIARVAVGTRTSVYAPIAELGQIILVNDGDPSFLEPHAPYAHPRDVALIRQRQSGCRLVFLSSVPSVAVERLIEIGYASAGAPVPHPRVIPAAAIWGDDPALHQARIPAIAYSVARQVLHRGPVLVQVARAGYDREVVTETGARTLAGAGRTADELGRAFPDIPVIVATADRVRDQVGPGPALVVATAGAEPRCPSGYEAVLLLDALSIVSREGLTAAEDAIRHWFGAAALARPDGTVVLTGIDGRLAEAMVAWDAHAFARGELRQRASFGLPPAVRFFSVTTEQGATAAMLEHAQLPSAVEVVNTESTAFDDGTAAETTLLRVPYSVGDATALALKAEVIRATTGPARTQRRLRVHADDLRALTTS